MTTNMIMRMIMMTRMITLTTKSPLVGTKSQLKAIGPTTTGTMTLIAGTDITKTSF